MSKFCQLSAYVIDGFHLLKNLTLFPVDWTGKSTLLNHLFGTNFREMDAFKGRHVIAFFLCYFFLKCFFFSMEFRKLDRVHFISGLKQLKVFGWQDVLV